MATNELPSPELLRKLLRYNKRTGKLHWRKRTAAMMRAPAMLDRWNRKYAGQEAFTAIGTHGYLVSNISGYGCLLAHRVIAAMVLGYWPECVDHDNRIRTDNRWRNLNATTHTGNHMNVSLRSDNTSGCAGVTFIQSAQRWRARIHHRKQSIRIGDYQHLADAIAARKKAEVEYGYHPRHGRTATGEAAARLP